MAIRKWHPLSELDTMRKEMERMWEQFSPLSFLELSPWRRGEEGPAMPALDVIDKDREVLVRMDMPGVEKDNIEVSVHEGSLTVRGEVKQEKAEEEENYVRRERYYRSYERTIPIPARVKADQIKADLKGGVLSIHLPKSEEAKTKKIKVEAG